MLARRRGPSTDPGHDPHALSKSIRFEKNKLRCEQSVAQFGIVLVRP